VVAGTIMAMKKAVFMNMAAVAGTNIMAKATTRGIMAAVAVMVMAIMEVAVGTIKPFVV
jgi:hypothetical protein